MTHNRGRLLEGLHILLVEDEYLIAMEMVGTLTGLGAHIEGPSPTVANAMAAMQSARQLHCAVLDINLGSENSYPVAHTLIDRGVPVIFVTGYDASMLPAPFASCPRLSKPFASPALARIIVSVAAQ